MTTDPKPVIATNRPGEGVAEAINARLAYWESEMVNAPEVRISTAYFNPGGYSLLADQLDNAAKVRLLLGVEPELPERRVRSLAEPSNRARAERLRLADALSEAEGWIIEERNLLGFSIDADANAKRLVKWLKSDHVEVRRLTDRFLHGKAFIIPTGKDMAMVGSSNFTYAGLSTNAELNLGRYDDAVELVTNWFDEMWDAAEDYDLARIYEARFLEHHPWTIYLRMLYAVYGADLAEEERRRASELMLAPFQVAGVVRAMRYLEERHGVIVADDVGLGKTFVAGEILMRFVRDNRQRALVIAPAVLRDGPWKRFLFENNLNVEVLSYEQLASESALHTEDERARLQAHLKLDVDDYSLVVVDEAHNLRNPAAQRSEALRRLLAGTPRKKIVLLTATPVNNSLMDVYHLLRFFVLDDAAFADRGITSMKARFDDAMAKDPEELSADDLFEILDYSVVRRTRSFVRKYHPNDRLIINGQWQTVNFPTPRPIQVDYDLEEAYPGLLERFAKAIEAYTYGAPCPDGVLAMARYMPSLYRLENIKFRKGEQFEIQLGGLLRSALLKRFESSALAFAKTARKMADSHDGMIELLLAGKVPTGRALTEWMKTDADDIEAFEELITDKDGFELEPAENYDAEALKRDLERDRDLLRSFAAEAEKVAAKDDPKLDAIVEELAIIAAQAAKESVGEDQERDQRKVLIFSYFADTVKWVHDHLVIATQSDPRLAAYKDRIVAVYGNDADSSKAMFGFAPKTTDPPAGADNDLFDIVIATDVLAEGVNLQQARHIINYDLPWNPMRLVQRHGRIDRLGSLHEEVFLRCVYPDKQLDKLLELEARLHRKLRQAMVTFGGTAPLPGYDDVDVSYTDDTKDVLDKLRAGDNSLFTTGGGTVLGEEFRQFLRRELERPGTKERLHDLPWGAGSGFVRAGTQPAWVFCAQVGDHPEARFAYVTLGPDGYVVDGNQLRSLLEARPDDEANTTRTLSPEMYEATFKAWDTARDHILESWEFATDTKNLDPKIPAVMDRAIAVVEDDYEGVLTVEEADALVERLRAPYPERLLRPVRKVLNEGSPKDQVAALAELADQLGFTPSTRPQPLPPVNEDDIHLLCWMAITPNGPAGLIEQLGELPLGDKL
ncbi:SNF2-related protein [Rhabdothermincola salaria]|uniref:SNF2-related protein n=1 Tax=Rhabdothermincola salaria TaxID=2903142 RepID=UPI001E51C81D|nr:SNF2-related protein [Rhabdothermincola salaria]MCD9624216.1 SNF2-related protein [Rhabdothermincola salaria]